MFYLIKEGLRNVLSPSRNNLATITVENPDFIRIEFTGNYPKQIEDYCLNVLTPDSRIVWVHLYRFTNVVLIIVKKGLDKHFIASQIARDLENYCNVFTSINHTIIVRP